MCCLEFYFIVFCYSAVRYGTVGYSTAAHPVLPVIHRNLTTHKPPLGKQNKFYTLDASKYNQHKLIK